MPSAAPLCPYVGLQPFREEDADYFFGREREIRVISANLQAEPLTVLYGASGVGKSSVLQAGVVRDLKKSSIAVVYFRTWQNDSSVGGLVERVNQFIKESRSVNAAPLFLLLDQFEEYLLYRAAEGLGDQFDSALARLVNADDVPARVLIGIREDSLSKLDQRFSLRIRNLLGNTLEVERLGIDAARNAIEKPLEVFNEKMDASERHYAIQPPLVEEILRQVQSGQAGISESSGLGVSAATAPAGRIETAFLQLVLKRLWDEEVKDKSFALRLETLTRIGGASRILDRHVNDVMVALPDEAARGIAARMFRYLVTPSRTKIPQATGDLVSYAEAPEDGVRTVLNHLTDRQESRILRRLAAPERYELYHDVLAQPVLDWRRMYIDEADRVARERELRVETERRRREARNLRWLVAALAAFLLASFLAVYAFYEGRLADKATAKVERGLRQTADLATARAIAAQKLAQEEAKRAEAAVADSQGKARVAEQLRAQADNYRAQYTQAQQTAETLAKKTPISPATQPH